MFTCQRYTRCFSCPRICGSPTIMESRLAATRNKCRIAALPSSRYRYGRPALSRMTPRFRQNAPELQHRPTNLLRLPSIPRDCRSRESSPLSAPRACSSIKAAGSPRADTRVFPAVRPARCDDSRRLDKSHLCTETPQRRMRRPRDNGAAKHRNCKPGNAPPSPACRHAQENHRQIHRPCEQKKCNFRVADPSGTAFDERPYDTVIVPMVMNTNPEFIDCVMIVSSVPRGGSLLADGVTSFRLSWRSCISNTWKPYAENIKAANPIKHRCYMDHQPGVSKLRTPLGDREFGRPNHGHEKNQWKNADAKYGDLISGVS